MPKPAKPRFESFRDVIALWDKPRDMAAALPGCSVARANKWWQRDVIPSDWWALLLATRVAKAAGLTSDTLTKLAGRERAPRRSRAEMRA